MFKEKNPLPKLFILNLKSVYSTTSSKLVVILSPILITISLTAYLPIQWFLVFGMVFCIPVSAGTVFGITYYPLRNSTIYSNISTSKDKVFYLYLSIYLTMLFVTFFSIITFLLTSIIFYYAGIASIKFIGISVSTSKSFDFGKIEWGVVIYYWLISTLFMFSISYIARIFIIKQTTYFLILVIFLLFQVPFGGLIPSSFGLYDGKWTMDIRDGVNLSSWYGVWNFYTVISVINPFASLNFLMYEVFESGLVGSGAQQHTAMSIVNCSPTWTFAILYPPIFISLSTGASIFALKW